MDNKYLSNVPSASILRATNMMQISDYINGLDHPGVIQ